MRSATLTISIGQTRKSFNPTPNVSVPHPGASPCVGAHRDAPGIRRKFRWSQAFVPLWVIISPPSADVFLKPRIVSMEYRNGSYCHVVYIRTPFVRVRRVFLSIIVRQRAGLKPAPTANSGAPSTGRGASRCARNPTESTADTKNSRRIGRFSVLTLCSSCPL